MIWVLALWKVLYVYKFIANFFSFGNKLVSSKGVCFTERIGFAEGKFHVFSLYYLLPSCDDVQHRKLKDGTA